MNVLWFTLSPCSSAERKDNTSCFGGWITSLEQMLRQFEDINLSIAFFSDYEDEPFDYKNVHYYPIRKTRIDRIITRIKGRNSSKYINKCREIINIVKPDIIHIHGTEHEFPLIVSHTSVPCVISIQGILSACLDKYFSGIPRNIALSSEKVKEKILARGTNVMYKLTKLSAKNELEAFKRVKYIIGRTEWDYIISRLVSPNSIYFKVDEILRSPFYNNIWNKRSDDGKIKIVTIMSDSLYKGLEVVYRTAKILKNYNIQFEWNILGQKKHSNYERIVRHYTKIDPLNVNVCLLGRKGPEELVYEMLSSDIYVQVSHIENSPNSLCEAMILGMPIIASFAGGTKSILQDKKEGLLYQDGDCYSLAGYIKFLYNNPDKAIKYAKAAREHALIRHDSSRICDQLINCYKDTLKQITI